MVFGTIQSDGSAFLADTGGMRRGSAARDGIAAAVTSQGFLDSFSLYLMLTIEKTNQLSRKSFSLLPRREFHRERRGSVACSHSPDTTSLPRFAC
ncbi:hypothetical protein Y032_0008g247 [Ancylostoma ceylanicum]|uniref:Uncharacterized protein n=1 Tax=Ancylostoma ceylanicum TaxID=53326 RepID=A0A016VKT5_9BILA|nr:hypothetical protein Y032_0008g247 [Ancylostoma ceylanicum]